MDKPLSVSIEEFKQNLVDTVQNSRLPIVVVDLIMKDFFNEIHELAKDYTLKEIQEYNNLSV